MTARRFPRRRLSASPAFRVRLGQKLGVCLWACASTLSVPLLGSTAAHAQAIPQVLGQNGSDPATETKNGQDMLLRGRYEDAIAAAKSALSRDERYVPAMIVMAKAYYYLRKYELAGSIIEISRGIDPNNADGYNLNGFISLAQNNKIAATAAFKKAVELNPGFGNAWDNLAAMYLEAKNYDGAVEASEKATQLLPTFAKAWLNLGSAYRGKGRYSDAEGAYRRALQYAPSYPEANFNLGILYFDAPQWPGMDLSTKLNTAISYLQRYRDLMASRLPKDDLAGGFVEDAKKAIDREKKRLERAAKQKEREKPKAPAAEPAATPAATPAAETTPATP